GVPLDPWVPRGAERHMDGSPCTAVLRMEHRTRGRDGTEHTGGSQILGFIRLPRPAQGHPRPATGAHRSRHASVPPQTRRARPGPCRCRGLVAGDSARPVRVRPDRPRLPRGAGNRGRAHRAGQPAAVQSRGIPDIHTGCAAPEFVMPTHRYPVLVCRDPAGGYSAIAVDDGTVGFGESAVDARNDLRTYLRWRHKKSPWLAGPDFLDPELRWFTVTVR